MTLTTKTAEVLAALRANAEGFEITCQDGRQFKAVYLDNALAGLPHLSRRMFAGHLSALEAAGLYVSQGDDCFGEVLIEKEEAR